MSENLYARNKSIKLPEFLDILISAGKELDVTIMREFIKSPYDWSAVILSSDTRRSTLGFYIGMVIPIKKLYWLLSLMNINMGF